MWSVGPAPFSSGKPIGSKNREIIVPEQGIKKVWIRGDSGYRSFSPSARVGRMKMPGASAISQAPAGRAQPTLVFRQIVAPVQPGHAFGAALVESGGQRTLAGHVTTPLTGKRSRPRRSGARKIPSRVARSGRRPHAERRGSEIRPRVSGRISFPPSLSSSSQASAGRVAPALT